MPKPENYISVDLETWGPYPEPYTIAAIGAVSLLTGAEFYIEMRPRFQGLEMTPIIDPESLAIHGLDHTKMTLTEGEGIKAFYDWTRLQPKQRVFASWSSFDWAFMYPALMRYCGQSPYSHSSLEMKSLLMGKSGCQWKETNKGWLIKNRPQLMAGLPPHTHNALDDAKEQAELLKRILTP